VLPYAKGFEYGDDILLGTSDLQALKKPCLLFDSPGELGSCRVLKTENTL
jgi:hypothetical protein